MTILRYYVSSLPTKSEIAKIRRKCPQVDFEKVELELCFHVVLVENSSLSTEKEEQLKWLLSKNPLCGNDVVTTTSLILTAPHQQILIEVGPRLRFTTAHSTNAVAACVSSGIGEVERLERSRRYLFHLRHPHSPHPRPALLHTLHDRMTEMEYPSPPPSFARLETRDKVVEVTDIDKANISMGLALDKWDVEHYKQMFSKMGRNPTDVELFDLAQSNSEHSRHWFFRGEMYDKDTGEKEPESLMQMIKKTQETSNQNNVIKFSDNSSGIRGAELVCLRGKQKRKSDGVELIQTKSTRHLVYTAETHNFPTGVCPFPGAATGTGGRIRDVQAVGRGGHVIAGLAGYSFGNLHIPHYKLPWELSTTTYPHNFASPLDVAIEASNGASDYGNKFGEPVIGGFARSFGMEVGVEKERVEYVKPIMFSGGVGAVEDLHLKKIDKPLEGMLVLKMGGPIYRIGVGGGSASSVHVQAASSILLCKRLGSRVDDVYDMVTGDASREDELDFGAVQRGDPEMEQKMNRALRACIEMEGDANPILSIHDQGAGGNGNVLKELVEKGGAVIEADAFELGDPTLSIRELWGAEYQESNAALIHQSSRPLIEKICRRERCPLNFVGTVTGDNRIVLKDYAKNNEDTTLEPVNLDLKFVLGDDVPNKKFFLKKIPRILPPLSLPESLEVENALNLVLRLPCVASKRYLTNKVDRSVGGLVAQQQCVGPFHTPLADCSVVAFSFYEKVGGALGLGEQPVKGLVRGESGGRMSVGESLTNLLFAPITALKDVKCSGNWMWGAKMEGEGERLVSTCKAMCGVMRALGVAVDGGKDSLSMAARVGNDVVKSPGTLVITSYAVCTDITKIVTPDLKDFGDTGRLMYIRFGSGMEVNRLGGTALAQCLGQTGNDCSDLDNPQQFVKAFEITQSLVHESVLRSGHDVSDGGLIVCLLEMAFAGNTSLNITLPEEVSEGGRLDFLFSEELGIVVEVAEGRAKAVESMYRSEGVPVLWIGTTSAPSPQQPPTVVVNDSKGVILSRTVADLRDIWEETSFELEKLQCNPACAEAERQYLHDPNHIHWTLPKATDWQRSIPRNYLEEGVGPWVGVVREEGSNGDREMAAAFQMCGFRVWDICMEDLLQGASLDRFRGLAFVGGFSYADVLGSAKGWASSILFHENVKAEFDRFVRRSDTFSLGVCNGCQLMALLGWVGASGSDGDTRGPTVFLDENESGRFESRFSSVKIENTESIFLKDMEGSVLGVWVSHGEGRFTYKEDSVLGSLESQKLIALRYVGEGGEGTEVYPLNPNGSRNGIAGLTSADGRHLALMPHPERCFLGWQWPHWPTHFPLPTSNTAPWLQIFHNAYKWSLQQK